MTQLPDQLHDVGWAAGFMEGEGSVHVSKHHKYGRIYAYIVLAADQVHREPLDQLVKIFQAGTVRGPYGPYSTNKQAYFQWAVSGIQAEQIAEWLRPYLFRKGQQIDKAIAELEELRNVRAVA